MEQMFLKILNMSIPAGWLILAVMALRFLFGGAPKRMRCILWGIVALRLLCPVSIESALSLVPSGETVEPAILYTNRPAIDSGISVIDQAVNPLLEQQLSPNLQDSVNPMQVITFAAAVLWCIGVAVMLLYAGISCLALRRKVAAAVPVGERVFACDEIETPFIFGVLKPRIYLPSAIGESEADYVLAHERAHLKHGDHWWKLLGFLILAVYWFHPLVWAAYALFIRDIELACDESVIAGYDLTEKKAYANALLSCSLHRRAVLAYPLAFGEVGVKERVKAVLHYKKPAFWIVLVTAFVCVAVAVCFLTNPRTRTEIGGGEEMAFLDAEESDDGEKTGFNGGEKADIGEKADVGGNGYAGEDTSHDGVNLDVDFVYENGVYVVGGDQIYRYKKELIGRSPNAARDGRFVVLTNDPDITFEEVDRSIWSSDSRDWLTDTVLIGIWTLEEDEEQDIAEEIVENTGRVIAEDAGQDAMPASGPRSAENWFSGLELPQGYRVSEYRDTIGWRGGFLILPNAYEVEREGTDTPAEWLSSGWIGQILAEDTNVTFTDGLPDLSGIPLQNHTVEEYIGVIGLERSNLQWPAILRLERHDLYTAAGIASLEERGVDPASLKLTGDYWTFYFVKEGESTYFILSLAAERFSREEAEEIAYSVVIQQ